MITLANNGITANGIRILSPQSVMELVKPRYNYHGEGGGAFIDFHLYGLGLYTTSYRQSDIVIEHSVTRGHTGSAYGLISAHYFFKDLTFAYIINGALNGYKNIPNSIYSY